MKPDMPTEMCFCRQIFLKKYFYGADYHIVEINLDEYFY